MHYFLSGFSLITQKGLKRFVIIPFIINLIIFSGAFIWLVQQLDAINQWAIAILPDWLSWLTFILAPLVVIATLTSFFFLFSALANFIAAPFNGLLSEKVEYQLTGQLPSQNENIAAMIGRSLQREWQKLCYALPRTIGFLLLFWFVPVIGQVLWFLFTAWMLAIQYCDYPFDNHQIKFDQMRSHLWQQKTHTFSFGAMAMIFTFVPVVNLLVMPVAVCGATKMWVDKYKNDIKSE